MNIELLAVIRGQELTSGRHFAGWTNANTITYPISIPTLALRSVPYVQYYCLHTDVHTSGLLQKIFQ